MFVGRCGVVGEKGEDLFLVFFGMCGVRTGVGAYARVGKPDLKGKGVWPVGRGRSVSGGR